MERFSKNLSSLKPFSYQINMMKKFSFLLGLFLCLCVSIGYAQNQDAFIKGKVTDPDGAELIGAPVQLLQNGNVIKSVLTDIDGKYSLGPDTPGT
jgi:hypothetical protein